MANYFQAQDYIGEPFQLFSISHLIPILILITICIVMFFYREKLRTPGVDNIIRYGLALLMISQEILLHVWRVNNDIWTLSESLPLELCSVSLLLATLLLLNKKYGLFEIVYFWGLGGAINSFITPDVGIYGFPHFRFIQFFISHGLIILAILYMVFVHKYYPTHKSILKTFMATILYGRVLVIINSLLDGNYLFICRKPEAETILDIMGPWPLYVIIFVSFTFLVCYILYIPFFIRNLLNKK